MSAALYKVTAPLLNGTPLALESFRGKVLLIVNTASKCGFTPQYAGLEEIYRAYKDRGFEVLGFPCNQFGKQEPGSEAEIGAFCQQNYGVSFPMFAKINVNGAETHPLYRILKAERRGFLGLQRISWNFTKFLVDREGRVAGRYAPSTSPTGLRAHIEELL